jgi:iron-sulfur cluster assembly protein
MESQPEVAPAPAAATAPASETAAPKKELTMSFTDKAGEAAKKQLAKRKTPDAMIRVGIKGGGCSGFSYVIEFEDNPPREGRDRVYEVNGAKFVVDKKSLVYLNGTVLDWKVTLMSQGFEFINPQVKSNCGCGHSFQV